MLDAYLTLGHLKTVTDLMYIETENTVVVVRKRGYKGAVIDINETASPSEAMDIVIHHLAVY